MLDATARDRREMVASVEKSGRSVTESARAAILMNVRIATGVSKVGLVTQ